MAMFHQLPALTWNRTPLRKENEGDTYVDARIDDIANYPGTDRVITVPAIEYPRHDSRQARPNENCSRTLEPRHQVCRGGKHQ